MVEQVMEGKRETNVAMGAGWDSDELAKDEIAKGQLGGQGTNRPELELAQALSLPSK